MIRIRDFTFSYAGTSGPALERIDLEIPPGQLCGVIGPNGAGRSTLCYALTGIIPHYYNGEFSGAVEVDGVEVSKRALNEYAGEIGLVFQNPFNQITGARYSVEEEIAFGLENLGLSRPEMKARVAEALQAAGLAELADRSPFALSGGQQQRLAIASILAMRPKVLVLDEPTSQLDPAGTREVFSLLRDLSERQRRTVVLVTGKLEWLAEIGDRILYLHGGKVIGDGSPREVLSQPWVEERGVSLSRYTLAARAAQDGGLVQQDRPLPFTLGQAQGFFQS